MSRIEFHPRLGSTQDRIRELARAGAPPGTAVRAGMQEAGRGRAGRPWVSEPDSGLWLSLLLPMDPEAPGGITLAVGVRLALLLEARFGRPLRIRWPNDLHLPDSTGVDEGWTGKLGGILCESAPGPGPRQIAVGIGVNVRRPGGGATDPRLARAAFLEEWAGVPVDVDSLGEAVVEMLAPPEGITPPVLDRPLLEELHARDLLRGRWVRTQTGERGLALGIETDGALRIRTDDGREVQVVSGSLLPADGPPSSTAHEVTR
jgi:BirA family transcriptional regulator, biotin operon repressor / biotin---[acetyl-CoA-carboxylase] ligase